jgi:hypothetical protein
MEIEEVLKAIDNFNEEAQKKPSIVNNPEFSSVRQEISELKDFLVEVKNDNTPLPPEVNDKFAQLDFMMAAVLKMA